MYMYIDGLVDICILCINVSAVYSIKPQSLNNVHFGDRAFVHIERFSLSRGSCEIN